MTPCVPGFITPAMAVVGVYMVCVIQEKAVTICAVPYSLMPLMFVSMAVVTVKNFL